MKCKGFTLIEILIVIAIFVLVAGTIGGTLAAGIRALNTVRHFQSAESMVLIGIEKMEREICSAAISSAVVFDGQIDALTFRLPTSDKHCAISVRYMFDSANQSILRSEWIAPLANYPFKKGEAIANGVISCAFSYGEFTENEPSEIVWVNKWDNPTNIPDVVRIDLRLQRSDGGELSLRRTFPVFSEMAIKEINEAVN